MLKLAKRIWYSEPVILVGGIVSAWAAIVAYDKADDSWAIETWVYVVAVPLTAFLTAMTRSGVKPTQGGK